MGCNLKIEVDKVVVGMIKIALENLPHDPERTGFMVLYLWHRITYVYKQLYTLGARHK